MRLRVDNTHMPSRPDGDVFAHLAFALSASATLLALWGLTRTGEWQLPDTSTFNEAAGGISSLVTAVAVAAGGAWAYFKFVRGRTFKTRLAINLSGEWRTLNEQDVLLVRVTVKNISDAQVSLNQYGSGLRIATPADAPAKEAVSWTMLTNSLRNDGKSDGELTPKAFHVLREHSWIEPGETVFDELLINLDNPKGLVMLELTSLWALSGKSLGVFSHKDVEMFTRRIIPPDEKVSFTVPN